MDTLDWICVMVATPWAVSVLVKIAAGWKRPEAAYIFSWWDGGIFFRDAVLGRAGALGLGSLAIAVLGTVGYLLVTALT